MTPLTVEGLHRPAWAEISASAIAHNVRALTSIMGEARFCGVVKADGYGHGAPLVATAALDGGADSLAVAIVDEGMELREAGVAVPILVFAEATSDVVCDALAHALTLTIGSLVGARVAVDCAEKLGGLHRVHLKVDTGMHRAGVAPEDVDAVVDVLRRSSNVEVEGLYTHFSVADGSRGEDRNFTQSQIALFAEVATRLADRGVSPRVVHAANSAGALGYPEARLSMVRVGLSLYGYLPSAWLAGALEEAGVHLRPALSLKARVAATRRVDAGERPSYGRRRALEAPATIVTVPFGYADGFPRRLFDAGAEVLIKGRRYPLAGTVTMDQIVVDVGDDDVRPGDEVVLLGEQVNEHVGADEWSTLAGTITWEILSGIGSRVPRVLVD